MTAEQVAYRQGDRMETGEDILEVLLIEDDPTVAEMYRLKLELDGYRVAVARTGEEGLAFAQQRPPDMVFLDLRLPRLDGFAVLEQLRRNPLTRSTPVIILSAYAEEELVRRGLELGAHEYLIKSETTPAKLSSSIRKWQR